MPDTESQELKKYLDEMNSLIGLLNVKKELHGLINFVRLQSLRRQKGLKLPVISLHMVFTTMIKLMREPGTLLYAFSYGSGVGPNDWANMRIYQERLFTISDLVYIEADFTYLLLDISLSINHGERTKICSLFFVPRLTAQYTYSHFVAM